RGRVGRCRGNSSARAERLGRFRILRRGHTEEQMPTPSDSEILVDEIASPIGCIVIAARQGRLCALEFGRARVARTVSARYGQTRLVRARNPFGISARIRAYLAGKLTALDRIAVDTGGTAFPRRVWQALGR